MDSIHHVLGRACSPREFRQALLLGVMAALLVVTAILAVLVSNSAAQAFEAKLWQQDSQFADHFGRTVFLAGGTAVVTEPGEDETGSVHVYVRDGKLWTALAPLVAPDSAAGARFGDALWLDGDTLVVGAPYDAEHGVAAGAVYVFERQRAGTPDDLTDDRWAQTAKLYPAAGPAPDRFGWAVCLRRGTLLVGARGAGFVFVRDSLGTPSDPLDDSWIQQAQILPSHSPTLGRAVLLLPGARTAVLGGDTDAITHQGEVRNFHRDEAGTPDDPVDDTWVDAGFLSGSDVGGAFGQSLAFAGSTLLVGGGSHAPVPPQWMPMEFVGAYDLDDAGTPSDPADDLWIPAGTMTDPGYPYFIGFGSTLALTDGAGPQMALVNSGAFQWSGPGPPPSFDILGSFRRDDGGWTLTGGLTPPDDAYADGFGDSLAIDGERALIGARGAPYDEMYEETPVEGAAWVLDLAKPSSWSRSWYGYPLAGWGVVDAGWPVTLRLYDSKSALTPAVLVFGLSAIYAPFKGETMVPLPQVLIPLVLGPNKDVALGGLWPAGMPSGTELWCQVWFPSPSGSPWDFSQVVVASQP